MKRLALAILTMSIFTARCSEGTDADSAVLVGKDIDVSSEWVTVAASPPLRMSGPQLHVWIAVPGTASAADVVLSGSVSDDLVMQDGTSRTLEVQLIGPDHQQQRLERISPSYDVDHRGFFLATSASVSAGRSFSGLKLRANGPIRVTHVIWLSCDPSHFQSGMMQPPKALLR